MLRVLFLRTRFELLKMCTNTKEIRIEFNFHASVGNFHASMWNFVPVCAFYLHNFLRSFSNSASMRLMLKIFSLRFDFYAKESSGIFKSHKCRDIIKAWWCYFWLAFMEMAFTLIILALKKSWLKSEKGIFVHFGGSFFSLFVRLLVMDIKIMGILGNFYS